MPLLGGGSVHDALKQDYRFSIGEAMSIAVDALDALAYLHREFLALHRDTKPGNVLLDDQRQHGYLSDFGSAATVDASGQAAAVLGTTIYRPPEARAVGRVGADADVYGIGMMLFEMLSGRIAWEALDIQEVERRLQRGLRALPDSRLEFGPHVPERLRRCVRKGHPSRPHAALSVARGGHYGTAQGSVRRLAPRGGRRNARHVDRHLAAAPASGSAYRVSRHIAPARGRPTSWPPAGRV
jgi:serine/threonine-protein kinase